MALIWKVKEAGGGIKYLSSAKMSAIGKWNHKSDNYEFTFL